jgi:hypothetical protein
VSDIPKLATDDRPIWERLAELGDALPEWLLDALNKEQPELTALRAERDELLRKLAEAERENTRLKQSANAWDALYNSIGAITDADVAKECTPNEHLDAYIAAWTKQKLRAESAEQHSAALSAKLTAIREIINKPTLLTDRYLRLLEIRRVLEETP